MIPRTKLDYLDSWKIARRYGTEPYRSTREDYLKWWIPQRDKAQKHDLKADDVLVGSQVCADEDCTSKCNVTLYLHNPLHVGIDFLAQTWSCTRRASSDECASLVVKLFHEALFPEPMSVPFSQPYSPSEDFAATESWAYNRLSTLQGTILPHFHGTYEFTLPNNQVVLGHVMEYVFGKNLDEFKPASEVADTMVMFLRAIRAIHDLGVRHGDLKPQNVLCTNRTHPIVILDFALSDELTQPRSENYGYLGDLEGVFACLIKLGGPNNALRLINSQMEFSDERQKAFNDEYWTDIFTTFPHLRDHWAHLLDSSWWA